jgi:DDE superfamily endonuclease
VHHAEYVLGFQDEVWWSRISQPTLHAWSDQDSGLRLMEQTTKKDDPEPKALACYGLLLSCPAAPETLPEQVWLRFVENRPLSPLTTQYLAWCCDKLEKCGKRALILIWDNASWHISQEVRTWIRVHNRQVRQQGRGVRIVACYLPSKSPWLNRIEPHWMHGKRNIVEPARLLSAQEVVDRVCTHFGCDHEPHLTITEKVA